MSRVAADWVISRGVPSGEGGLLERVVPADRWNEKRRLCLGRLLSDATAPLSLGASFVEVSGRMRGREGISPILEFERLKKDMTLLSLGVCWGVLAVDGAKKEEESESRGKMGGGRGGSADEGEGEDEEKTADDEGEPADVFGRRRRNAAKAEEFGEGVGVDVPCAGVACVVRDLVDRDARRGALGTSAAAACGTCRV